MQTQPIPILIFAQSGRFLAQSANQAGYTVWVADCYGDADLLAVTERNILLPPFANLTQHRIFTALSELTRGEQCLLICGSGIEYCYDLLLPLPANIQLIGNTLNTIQSIKSPSLFYDLLNRYAFSYPETQFEIPCDDSVWLKKPARGLGGTDIQYLVLNTNNDIPETYYQRFVSGDSGSCLFLADGHHAHIVNINRQFLAPDSDYPFRLGRIESAWQLSTSHNALLQKIINQLTATVTLQGLNSLDFVISDQDQLLILEINPRVSASAELIDNKASLFQQHLNACLGQLPSSSKPLNHSKMSLFYHYATSDFIVPECMQWPAQCHDLPVAGSIIKHGDPICTSIVEPNEDYSVTQLHFLIEQAILKQLITAT